MTTWRVYSMSDPDTRSVRYVGVTSCNPIARAECHVKGSVNLRLRAWLDRLSAEDKFPVVAVLFQSPSKAESFSAERSWIVTMLNNGEPLANIKHVRHAPREESIAGREYRKSRFRAGVEGGAK